MNIKIITAVLAISLSGCAPTRPMSPAEEAAYYQILSNGLGNAAAVYQYRRPVTCGTFSSNIGGPVESITCY